MVDQLSGNESIMRDFALCSVTRRTIPIAATVRARPRGKRCATCSSFLRSTALQCVMFCVHLCVDRLDFRVGINR